MSQYVSKDRIKKMMYYIGIMSGTSMDGIDVALVDVDHNHLVNGQTFSFSKETHEILNELVSKSCIDIQKLAKLNRVLAFDYSKATQKIIDSSSISLSSIQAIGCHGQTVSHHTDETSTYTLQLGCPNTIASLTGLKVVADFRSRDIAYGGQGAPLAPLYHARLFSGHKETIAIVNVGGIANISFVSNGEALKGYDVGPGNCLLDFWIQKHLNEPFDEYGAWSKKGKVHQDLLDKLLNDNYLKGNGPKSIGKEYYTQGWLKQFNLERIPAEDVQATFLSYTCEAILKAVEKYPETISQVVICGGGAYNKAMLEKLQCLLSPKKVVTTRSIDVDPGYVEAMMIAWLASCHVNNELVDLRCITGSKKPILPGNIYLP